MPEKVKKNITPPPPPFEKNNQNKGTARGYPVSEIAIVYMVSMLFHGISVELYSIQFNSIIYFRIKIPYQLQTAHNNKIQK